MKIRNDIKQEIIGSLRSGFSVDDTLKAITKKHKDLKITKSDIVIIAKQANIKTVSGKNMSKSDKVIKGAEQMLPKVLNDEGNFGKAKNSILVFTFAVLLLLGVLWYWLGIETMLIGLSIIVAIVLVLYLIVYFTIIRKSPKIKDLILKSIGLKK